MDTKWKKFNMVAGFAAFFAGVSLLIGGAAGLAGNFVRRGYQNFSAEEIRDGDYQNTEAFRGTISGRLKNFLAAATGAPVLDYGAYDWEEYLEYVEQYGAGALEDSMDAVEGDWDADWDDGWYETTPEENRKMAEKMQGALEKDKNLLYAVSFEGKLLYTNGEDVMRCRETGKLPEGYNFLLYFDGNKTEIIKDGKPADIYGDGYYTDDSADWYVPGYKNFTVDGDMRGARVCMIAAKEPKRYVYGVYGRSGYREAESELYRIWDRLEERRAAFFADICRLGAGALLLLVYGIFRKGKRKADEAVARFAGHIFLEVKLALAALLFFSFFVADGWDRFIMTVRESMSSDSFLPSWLVWDILRDIAGDVGDMLTEPLALVLLFWVAYVAVLDLKKNKKWWRQSLAYKAAVLFQAGKMRLPLAKKLIYRCVPATVCAVLAGVSFFLSALFTESVAAIAAALCLLLVLGGALYYQITASRRLAQDLDCFAGRLAALKGGAYAKEGEGSREVPRDSDLSQLLADLEDIGQGMEKAVEEQMKSQRMKVELVANVSHDIKTPLTSIISYVNLLKQEEGLPEHVRDYVRILDEKSQRLKNMVQDVFAVSKAASGQLAVNMEALDFGKLLRQTMADMEEQIRKSPVTLKADIPEQPVMIEADGQKLYRVFQNLIQNALKYSLEGSRVFITVKQDATLAVASVTNTSRFEIEAGKDFTERFVRGDESRTDGGSGLGLSIARNFTEACGGDFKLETIADLFVVTVSFRALQP